MKKRFIVFLVFVFLLVVSGATFAEEKIVRLTVPGCAAWGASSRIGAILNKVEGVKKYEFKRKDFLIITFDDEVVSIEAIIDELNKGKDKLRGKPLFLK